jgi:hypothetical protein
MKSILIIGALFLLGYCASAQQGDRLLLPSEGPLLVTTAQKTDAKLIQTPSKTGKTDVKLLPQADKNQQKPAEIIKRQPDAQQQPGVLPLSR